jgi:ubiquinone/menaquinone biosynthesis C-methylase UbiE
LKYISPKPAFYVLCDVTESCLKSSQEQLESAGIANEVILLDSTRQFHLPFPDNSFDIFLSFNVFEHLYPLKDYLIEISRILKIGGYVAGGIPCEGGLAWGLGRFLTTRRYAHKCYGINYDKIICWEHPNFADQILECLAEVFKKAHIRLKPFPFLPIDLNLVASFIYRKI